MTEISFFKDIIKKYKKNFKSKNNEILIYQIVRDSIDLMVKDIMANTNKNIKKFKIKSLKDIYKSNDKVVCLSNEFIKIENEIKNFLRSNMYNNEKVLKKNNKGKKIVSRLFSVISRNPKKYLRKKKLNEFEKFRAISDYISGMTDRYAINLYNGIK